jgi:hypothetical protein
MLEKVRTGSRATGRPPRWRRPVSVALIVAGCLALAGALVAHWGSDRVLSTDRWVVVAGPLPQDPAVARALSVVAVDHLFERVDVESAIGSVLPSRASFLASTLAAEVRTRAQRIARRVLESNTFRSVWDAANRLVHARIVAIVRNEERRLPLVDRGPEIAISLGPYLRAINTGLDAAGIAIFTDEDFDRAGRIVIAKTEHVEAARGAVDTLDDLDAFLPYLAAALLLAALALSVSRWRTLFWIGAGTAFTGAVLLIALRFTKPIVLDRVEEPINRDAAGAIWNAAFGNFTRILVGTILIGALVAAIGFGAPRLLRWVETRTSAPDGAAPSQLALAVPRARAFVMRRKRTIQLAAAVALLVALIFTPDLTWPVVVIGVAVLGLFLAVLEGLGSGREAATDAPDATSVNDR